MHRVYLKISSYINKIAINLNLPFLNAVIFFLNLKKLNINYKKNCKKTIIILYRHDGVSDIKEAYKNNKESSIKFLIFPRLLLKDIFNYFLKGLVNDYYYVDIKDKEINKKKQEYFDYLKKILVILNKFTKFHAILSFNVFYYAERELQRVSKNLNIKFLVLLKEGISTNQVKKQLSWQLKNTADKFFGDKIATYNIFRKNMLIEANTVKKKDIQAIGIPRYDKIFKYSKNIKNRNSVVYFSLRKEAGFFNSGKDIPNNKYKSLGKKIPKTNLISEKKLQNILKKNEKKMISILLNLARKNPNIDVIVKYKTGEGNYFINVDKKPSNMYFITEGSGYKLLENCKVAIGFNTSALYEAIIASCKVLVVSFDIDKKKYKDSLLNYFGMAEHVFDKSKMTEKLNYYVNNHKLKKVKINNKLKLLVGKLDGSAQKKLRQFLNKSLN